MKKYNNVDEYLSSFPKEIQKVLKQVRETIKKTAPQAEEKISYGVPSFTLNGKQLIYFAGFKKHIGVYPSPVTVDTFKKDFSKYKTGKGSVQLPLDQPMPLTLITKIVKYRIKKLAEEKAPKKIAKKIA